MRDKVRNGLETLAKAGVEFRVPIDELSDAGLRIIGINPEYLAIEDLNVDQAFIVGPYEGMQLMYEHDSTGSNGLFCRQTKVDNVLQLRIDKTAYMIFREASNFGIWMENAETEIPVESVPILEYDDFKHL